MSIQSDTTKSIESLLEICKTLRNFIDLQSKRIDLLQKQFDTNQKILARYQMTEGSDLTNSPLEDLKKIVEGNDVK